MLGSQHSFSKRALVDPDLKTLSDRRRSNSKEESKQASRSKPQLKFTPTLGVPLNLKSLAYGIDDDAM